ncbi:NTP transferase domain-containing protein [Oceanobacillus massiliensis]|uniref:NTP transferase domain-containing protein n=1 Tax=Oceanobacillus massiliensis TaxID=1465765 RepID=UPI00028A0ECA|nr:NTP transferase domain-containing protein [Oceanobacillus massiliensis]
MSVKVIGICLAAGNSSRMGKDKLPLQIGGTTIGSSVFEKAVSSELNHTLIVSKESDSLDWIDTKLWKLENKAKWSSVSSSESMKGQAFSLRRGIECARQIGADAVLIMLADQPFLQVEMVNDLIHSYDDHLIAGESLDYIASRLAGVIQPPILISRTLFPALLKLDGDQGARSILRDERFKQNGICVDYEDRRYFFDVDTMDDYRKAEELNVCLNQNR